MYRISREDRRIFSTQIPILKSGGGGLSRRQCLQIQVLTAFGYLTSSRVRLNRTIFENGGPVGVNNA